MSSSRATTFISRPSETWLANAELLSNTTLFMVARIGPTVFTLKDEQDGTFRVTLGNPHTCTCGNSQETCIHKLFCLIKVLRVPVEHSLCYQTSLTDNEMDQVLDGIPSQSRRRPTRTRPAKAIPVVSGEVAKDMCVPRQPLLDGEENFCTICMDDMTTDQALTWCRVGCGQNIHAKCMMKCAQHNITNRLQITCPLCRNPMDLATLKLDCKGKASLKQTYAPVQCNNCKCHQRGTFYRCIECSQLSCHGSGKPYDFCPECFERQNDPAHFKHHFVRSDIVTEASHGLEWTPCKNPATRGVITNPELIRELQTRELGVNDYDLLLQLSDGGPTPELPTLCMESLPVFSKAKNAKKTGMKTHCWCAAASSPSRMQSDIHISSPLTGAATMIVPGAGAPSSPIRHTEGDASFGVEPYNANNNSPIYRAMRILPCRHVAHDRCIRGDLALLVEEDSGKIVDYRCAHAECGKKIFIGLSRKRRSRKSAADSAAGMEAKPAAMGTGSAQEQSGMGGIIGASCFGSTVSNGTVASSSMTVNRHSHRRGKNSFGSGSDLSTGALESMGVTGTAPGPQVAPFSAHSGTDTPQGWASMTEAPPPHRPVHLESLAVPALAMRSERSGSYHSDRNTAVDLGILAVSGARTGSTLSGANVIAGHGSMGTLRRPPVGRRVRLRALGDATPAAQKLSEGMFSNSSSAGHQQQRSLSAMETIVGRGHSRNNSEPIELGSLSDRTPSHSAVPGIRTHHRAASLSTLQASAEARRAQEVRAHAHDVLVFNLSKESRQRNRERARAAAHVADNDLIVNSTPISNPSAILLSSLAIGSATGGSGAAGYPLQIEQNTYSTDPSATRQHPAGRKPGGRIARGLSNRQSAVSESGPLPTL